MKRFCYAISTVLTVSLLAAYAHAYDITLAWDPNAEPDVVGYNLYVRLNDSEYSLLYGMTLDDIDPSNPQFMVTNLETDVAYDFVVTAENADGLESDFSNVVSVLNSEILHEEIGNNDVSVGNNQVYSDGGSDGGGGGGCFISVAGDVFQ
jgi:hypothetical protein